MKEIHHKRQVVLFLCAFCECLAYLISTYLLLMVLLQKALWIKVEERCTQALALNKVYIKAFHRRAKARVAVEKFRGALLGKMNMISFLSYHKSGSCQERIDSSCHVDSRYRIACAVSRSTQNRLFHITLQSPCGSPVQKKILTITMF